MRTALVALLLAPAALALLPAAGAAGVLDAGAATLEGVATDRVARRLVLDLWDADDPPRVYLLEAAPGSAVPEGLEARVRPRQGDWGPWTALPVRVAAGADPDATERGWDGAYELEVRMRLPNAPRARLDLHLLAEAPAGAGLWVPTELRAVPLALHAAAEPGPGGVRVRATVDGPKLPTALELLDGGAAVPLRASGAAWEAVVAAVSRAAVVRARFADGGALVAPLPTPAEGPAPADGADAPPAAPAAGPLEEAASPTPAAGTPAPAPAPPPANEGPAPGRPGLDEQRATPAATLPISLGLASIAARALSGSPAFKRPPRI